RTSARQTIDGGAPLRPIRGYQATRRRSPAAAVLHLLSMKTLAAFYFCFWFSVPGGREVKV
ncbi:MAG TPA: hypothetical protein PLZ13_14800, partial [Ottowia sp.]|nr:hypothetical protein [Ottowia sp.]